MRDYSIFGERVKLQLEKNNISQKELAEKTGITEATISRYISSQRIPKATEILKIAKVLNCTSDFLLGIDSKGIKNISLKDAIYNLKMNRPFMESEWQNTIDIAIQALEKQIPKKLKEHTQSQYGCIPVCGVCNGIMDLMQGDLNYCPNCGQKLDWSDEE